MTLLNPGALAFLLAIPAAILFHLLKIRRRQVSVSSTLLWADSLRDQRATAPFRRLKPSLLLLLQILILLLLALALARPVRTVLVSGYERTILVVDVTASMQAPDANGSRLAAAKAGALRAVASLAPGQQAMLIAAGREARVLVPFTDNAPQLRRKIEELEAQDVGGRLDDALRLVRANLEGSRGRAAAVEVFTDGAYETPGPAGLEGASLHWHWLGRRGGNVGITAFEARRTYFGAFEYQVFLSVANYGGEAAAFDLVLTLEGRPVATERVILAPDTKRSFVFPVTDKDGGVLKAEARVRDDLAADNQVVAVLPPARPIRTLVVGGRSGFLEKALAADPQVQAEFGGPELLGRTRQFDVVVLDGVRVESLPPGRYLFLNTLPPGSLLEAQGRVEDPPIVDWDRTHPVMRYLDLSKVRIQEALRVRPLGGGRALVESSLTPLVYALDEGGTRAVYVGFDLTRSDLPLRVAFPLFVSNALRWLAPSHGEAATAGIRTGQPLVASLPAGVREAVLTTPGGGRHTLAADADGRVSFGDTTAVGIYTLTAGEWQEQFAVNLLDEAESNDTPRAHEAAASPASAPATPAVFPSRTELWPLLAILALALLLAEGALYHREVRGRWPLLAAAARGLIVLLVVGGLLGLGLYRTTEALNVIFVLDASDSVSLESRLRAREIVAEAVRAADPRDRYGVVTFGESATLELPVGRDPVATRPAQTSDSRATDIGGAIRLALAAFPQEGAKRIVLLSDGNENRGAAREAARQAKADGADIQVLPLREARDGEVLVERLVLPQEVKAGESFLVRVVAWSAGAAQGRLSLYKDGEFVGAQAVTLTPGKNVFAYQQAMDRTGFHVFQARLESPGDVIEENNRGIGLVAVRGRPKVLYAEKDRDQGANLRRALQTQGLDVEMVGPEALPTTMAGLTRYDALILSNVSALRMSRPQMELVRGYVRDQGGGLVMLGGDESFGVGGYYHTPIEEALPVTMEARQKVEIPSLAVVLVLDRSGSMDTSVDGRLTKLDLAKEAAQLVVELLDERNEVGVIAFDTAWSWVVPMGPAKEKDRIIREIATVKAGGGTDLFPPLKEAYQTIYDRKALLRHVLVLSDGEVTAADFPGLVRRMQKDKVTVSSVAVGKDSDIRFMTDISRWGRGRFYYTEDIYSIPRILTLETQLASKASIIEQAFRPQLTHPGHEIVQDVHWAQAPPLGGYVSTTPKPTADLLLVSHQRDPILAAWRYGLGRSVAFTSDAKAKWGILWVKWDDYAKLFGQMVRWSLRTTTRKEVVATVEAADGQGEVVLEAVDEKGDFINFLDATSGIVFPDKSRQALPLTQVGPGRYRTRFGAREQGAYLVGVSERKDQKLIGSEVASLVVPYSPEHRALGTNESLLHDLATVSGGGMPTAPGHVFTQGRRPARVWVEGWPTLLALALLLFLADVAVRRLAGGWRASRSGRGHGSPVPAGAITARFGRGRR